MKLKLSPFHNRLIISPVAGYTYPRLVGLYNNSSGNPTVPSSGSNFEDRQAGDTFLAIGMTTASTTEPTLDVGTRITGAGGNNCAITIWQFDGSVSSLAWTGTNTSRYLVHLRNVGRVAAVATTAANSTSLTWPSLVSGDGSSLDEIANEAIVGGMVLTRNTQTDIGGAIGLGAPYTQRHEIQSASARYAFDSGDPAIVLNGTTGTEGGTDTYVTSFSAANDTFDTTSSGHAVLVWAAEGI